MLNRFSRPIYYNCFVYSTSVNSRVHWMNILHTFLLVFSSPLKKYFSVQADVCLNYTTTLFHSFTIQLIVSLPSYLLPWLCCIVLLNTVNLLAIKIWEIIFRRYDCVIKEYIRLEKSVETNEKNIKTRVLFNFKLFFNWPASTPQDHIARLNFTKEHIDWFD